MLDAILAKEHLTEGPNQRLFNFISGIGDEQVYDVSFINTSESKINSIFNSMLRIAQNSRGSESIGTHHDISQNDLLILLP